MGEVHPAETGSPCSIVAQKVALHERAERWDMHLMVGSLKEVEVEGGSQRTKRTHSHMAKLALGMGGSLARTLVEQGTEEVVLPNKGEDPWPRAEEEDRW